MGIAFLWIAERVSGSFPCLGFPTSDGVESIGVRPANRREPYRTDDARSSRNVVDSATMIRLPRKVAEELRLSARARVLFAIALDAKTRAGADGVKMFGKLFTFGERVARYHDDDYTMEDRILENGVGSTDEHCDAAIASCGLRAGLEPAEIVQRFGVPAAAVTLATFEIARLAVLDAAER